MPIRSAVGFFPLHFFSKNHIYCADLNDLKRILWWRRDNMHYFKYKINTILYFLALTGIIGRDYWGLVTGIGTELWFQVRGADM